MSDLSQLSRLLTVGLGFWMLGASWALPASAGSPADFGEDAGPASVSEEPSAEPASYHLRRFGLATTHLDRVRRMDLSRTYSEVARVPSPERPEPAAAWEEVRSDGIAPEQIQAGAGVIAVFLVGILGLRRNRRPASAG